MSKKPLKHLRFELSPQEYADFWSTGGLFNLTKKKEILLKLIETCKKVKSK